MKVDKVITGWFVLVHLVALIGPFFYTTPGAVAAGVVLYLLTGLFGITLGYHRLLTHRSFKTTRAVERFLGTCGVLAMQRGPLEWVAHHRMHHAHVDTPKDPHNARQGFFWAHVGWMCFEREDLIDMAKLKKFARDIVADPYLNWLTPLWVHCLYQGALAALLFLIGGPAWVVWGIFVRLFVVYHITWFVNSATHLWGYRNYDTDDLSTNNWWVGLLAFGEGWHNNHHAEPDVAPAGRSAREFDLTWQVIRLMRFLGLAWDVKLPELRLQNPTAVYEKTYTA
jgi:fatty-acid desaturase